MLKKVILLNFLLFFSFTNSFGFFRKITSLFENPKNENRYDFYKTEQELIYSPKLKQTLSQEDIKFFSKKYRINKTNNIIELETNQRLIVPENTNLIIEKYESLYINNIDYIDKPDKEDISYLILKSGAKIILKRGARLNLNGIILIGTIDNFEFEDVSYIIEREEIISNNDSREPIILITKEINPGLANDIPKIIYNKSCDLNNLEKNISDQNLILKN
ncbi:MAG: hypothetical protein SZ59_C0002G0370 [candidate division TM6 bacterium GW2011_GWF2_28_16]|jgi:hypothetical protein|nr:MAG: hypothetical protein SZ59_C0002G0370 [candidate division TM6 bacterium GW2011_GWF2_28_16]